MSPSEKERAKLRWALEKVKRRRLRVAASTVAWFEAGLGPRDDPPIAADKRCACCPRARPAIAKAALCPFCSSECCMVWHDPGAIRWRAWALARAR